MLIFYSPTKVHSPTLLHVLVCFLRIFFLLDSDYLNFKLCKVQLRFKSNLKEWWTWTWEGPKTRYHEIVTNDSHVLIRSKSFLSSSSTKTKEICIKTAICNTRNIMTGNGKIKEKNRKMKEHYNTCGETENKVYCYWSSMCRRHVAVNWFKSWE